jgi:hypothetical protein
MKTHLTEQKIIQLTQELCPEKLKLIEKYRLRPNIRLIWYSEKENTFPKKVFKQRFLVRNDLLALVFRVYELCAAKLTYYRGNWEKYAPYVYHFKEGFVETELWDMEFLKHLPSGYYIDLRYLQRITDINDFRKFCVYLETFE